MRILGWLVLIVLVFVIVAVVLIVVLPPPGLPGAPSPTPSRLP